MSAALAMSRTPKPTGRLRVVHLLRRSTRPRTCSFCQLLIAPGNRIVVTASVLVEIDVVHAVTHCDCLDAHLRELRRAA